MGLTLEKDLSPKKRKNRRVFLPARNSGRVRLLVVALASVIVAGCLAPGTPAGLAPLTERSLDFRIQDRWVFAVVEDGKSFNATTTLANVSDGVARFHTVESRSGPAGLGVTQEIVLATLALKAVRNDYPRFAIEYSPPLPVFLPQEDHAWSGQVTIRSDYGVDLRPGNATIEFVGEESVTVPAGTFRAWHYRTAVTVEANEGQRSDVWLNPDVKLPVKTVAESRSEELLSYAVT